MPWVNEEMCVGCGICVDECPVGAVAMTDQGYVVLAADRETVDRVRGAKEHLGQSPAFQELSRRLGDDHVMAAYSDMTAFTGAQTADARPCDGPFISQLPYSPS